MVTVDAAPTGSAFAALAGGGRRAAAALGRTGGDRLRIRLVAEGAARTAEERGAGVADDLDEPLDVLRDAWEHGLPRALGDDAWRPEPHPEEG